jgi:parallel beta-helix repeat protein
MKTAKEEARASILLHSVSKKAIYAVMATLFLLSILKSGVCIQWVRADPTTWTVDDDDEADFHTIQEAVNAASNGDSITVYNGIYCEHLVINRPITLIGESREGTVIDGSGENRNIVEITANRVVFSGFTVQNTSRTQGTSYAGFKVLGRECNISGNDVTRSKIGIFVTSQKSRIEENSVANNGQGIALYSSSEVTVKGNNVSANTVGISLAFSSNNLVVGNKAANSSFGGHGITLSSNSFDNTVKDNDLVNNFHGMWLSDSFDNLIINNTIANNELLGIELASSSSNTFYHNNFINNGLPPRAPCIKHIVIKDSTCIWDNGYPSGGNHWHDYTGVDEKRGSAQDQLGSDQIWDDAYIIDGNNMDRYPSVNPYGDISHIISDEQELTAKAGPDKTVKLGSTVSFDASSSTGDIAGYEWDFGDGTTGKGMKCSHTYYEIGTYTATVTVKDAAGNVSKDQLTVTVVADDASPQVNVSPPWISALAGVIVIVMAVALIWKQKISKKTRKKKMRRLHVINLRKNAC